MYVKCIYHILFITDVSTTVAAIFRVIYKITKSPNELLKYLCL